MLTLHQIGKVLMPSSADGEISLTAGVASAEQSIAAKGGGGGEYITVVSEVAFNVRGGNATGVTAPTSNSFYAAGSSHSFWVENKTRFFKFISPSSGDIKWYKSSS